MHFDEADEGDYRIYAGAMEAPVGNGYTAAVVISRMRGLVRGPREAYRDPLLAGGHRWDTPDEALRYALSRARDVIRMQHERLAR